MEVKDEVLKELILQYKGKDKETLKSFAHLFSPYIITVRVWGSSWEAYDGEIVATASSLAEAKKIWKFWNTLDAQERPTTYNGKKVIGRGFYDLQEFKVDTMSYKEIYFGS